VRTQIVSGAAALFSPRPARWSAQILEILDLGLDKLASSGYPYLSVFSLITNLCLE